MNPPPNPFSRSEPDPGHEPDLVAFVRGEASPEETARVRAAAAADPAVARDLLALERLFRSVQEVFEPAPQPAEIAAEARRVAAYVRSRVAGERPATAARERTGRRHGWARFLAWSLAAHAAALGVVALRPSAAPGRASDGRGRITARIDERGELRAVPLDETRRSGWAHGGLPEGLGDSPLKLAAGDALRDPIVPDLAIPLAPDTSEDEFALTPSTFVERVREYPAGLGIEMLARTDEAFKRRRLAHLDLDPDGTLKRVRLGLDALALRQRADGSFAPGGGRGEVGQTALAMMPFLGDGRGSRAGNAGAEVAARSVAWLRGRLFPEDWMRIGGRVADAPQEPGLRADVATVPVPELGIALAALAEDYMVSYGRLSPAEGARRASELAALTDRVVAAQDAAGSFSDSDRDATSAVWPMWGIDAAVRTGAVTPPREAAARFARWYAQRPRTDEGVPRRTDGSADPVLTAAALLLARDLPGGFADGARRETDWVRAAAVPSATSETESGEAPLYLAVAGTGLLRLDADAFRAWTHVSTEAIARRLGPTGLARQGDAVGDTALLILALQAAYRTY